MYNIKFTPVQLNALYGFLMSYMVTGALPDQAGLMLADIQKQQDAQRESVEAFDKAIAAGVLSNDKERFTYAGNWMFIGQSWAADKKYAFKHVNTREYLHI